MSKKQIKYKYLHYVPHSLSLQRINKDQLDLEEINIEIVQLDDAKNEIKNTCNFFKSIRLGGDHSDHDNDYQRKLDEETSSFQLLFYYVC